MLKKTILIIIIFSLLIVNTIYADDLETISFMCPKRENCKITLKGYFIKPGLIAPNDVIFSYEEVPWEVSWTGKVTNSGLITTYRFIGRTGEKTFEMTYRSSWPAPAGITKKANMYLDETLYPLGIISLGYTNCTKDDNVLLKMIKLQGNQLEYQIILPDCLTQK